MIRFSYEYLSNDAMCTVFINNNRAGSAFLFLHNGKIYALTAYHCIFDDNDDQPHDNIAFGYENERPFKWKIIYPKKGNKEQEEFAKSNDIALVSIMSGECSDRNVSCLHFRIKLSSKNDYSIIGYPCNIPQKDLIELDVKFKHQGNSNVNVFNLIKKEEISVIKGFSGGIVCEKIDDYFYFCGLVSRALSENFEYAYHDSINSEITQLLKNKINRNNNKSLMELFGPKLLETKNQYKGRAFTGFFDLFMVETVLNWIDENPIERAPLLAYHLSYPTLDTPKCSELTLRVLEKYSDLPDTLKEFEKGTYNLKAENISEVRDNKEKYLSLYQTYKEYDNPISEWARWKIDYINYTCNTKHQLNYRQN